MDFVADSFLKAYYSRFKLSIVKTVVVVCTILSLFSQIAHPTRTLQMRPIDMTSTYYYVKMVGSLPLYLLGVVWHLGEKGLGS